MFNKKEFKTIKNFVEILNQGNIAKIVKIKGTAIYKKITPNESESQGFRVLAGYQFVDEEGNHYIPDDIIPLQIIDEFKLGARPLTMWSAIKKGFSVIPQAVIIKND